MTLKIKWSYLTKEQRRQASEFHKDDIKGKDKLVLNQMTFSVNPLDGNLIFRK